MSYVGHFEGVWPRQEEEIGFSWVSVIQNLQDSSFSRALPVEYVAIMWTLTVVQSLFAVHLVQLERGPPGLIALWVSLLKEGTLAA